MEKKKLMDLMRKAKEEINFQPTVHAKLAKKVNDGMMCILCKTVLKSNKEWVSHCSSDTHKNNLIALKNKKSAETSNKRPLEHHAENVESNSKRIKLKDEDDYNEMKESSEDDEIYDESFLREYIEFEATLSTNTNTETTEKEVVKSAPLPEILDFGNNDIDDEPYTSDRGIIFSDEGLNESDMLSKIDSIKKETESLLKEAVKSSTENEELEEEMSDEDDNLDDLLLDGWRNKKL